MSADIKSRLMRLAGGAAVAEKPAAAPAAPTAKPAELTPEWDIPLDDEISDDNQADAEPETFEPSEQEPEDISGVPDETPANWTQDVPGFGVAKSAVMTAPTIDLDVLADKVVERLLEVVNEMLLNR
jgi:hypothetical protein